MIHACVLVGEEGGHSLTHVRPDVEEFDVCLLEEKKEEEEEGCEEHEDEIVNCQRLSYSAFLYYSCHETVKGQNQCYMFIITVSCICK